MMEFPHEGSLGLWLKVVREIIGVPTKGLTLLDLCCNECTGTGRMEWRRHVGVDVVDWGKPASVDFKLEDALAFVERAPAQAFDVCICSDGVEHFRKEEGWRLVRGMKRVGRLSIVFCPLGNFSVDVSATHPDCHKSAWWPEELEKEWGNAASFPRWHRAWNSGAWFAWTGRVEGREGEPELEHALK